MWRVMSQTMLLAQAEILYASTLALDRFPKPKVKLLYMANNMIAMHGKLHIACPVQAYLYIRSKETTDTTLAVAEVELLHPHRNAMTPIYPPIAGSRIPVPWLVL